MNKINCLLKISDLSKSFIQNGSKPRTIFSGISFELEPQTILGLTGPNGSGKTTLLNIISGDLNPDKGSIVLENKELNKQSPYQRAKIIGRVNQESYKNIASELTVEELLAIAYKRNKILTLKRPECFKPSDEIEKYNIEAGAFLSRFKKSPSRNLSGGERQVLAFILALLGCPKLILLDEHQVSMDAKYGEWTNKILMTYVNINKCSVIAVTHDLEWSRKYTNQRFELDNGTLKTI